MDGDKFAGYHSIGGNAGLFVYRRFSDKISGQIELKFSQKGATAGSDYRRRLNYMEIPLIFRYMFKKKIGGEAGISPSVLVYDSDNRKGYSNNDKLSTYDFPMCLGVHYTITPKLAANARYSYSMIPTGKYYNNAIQLVIFYRWK
jgi:hypothetical protein